MIARIFIFTILISTVLIFSISNVNSASLNVRTEKLSEDDKKIEDMLLNQKISAIDYSDFEKISPEAINSEEKVIPIVVVKKWKIDKMEKL
jgi:hypothetical protein